MLLRLLQSNLFVCVSFAVMHICLLIFVIYLWLPRAIRKQYFGAYPKRHAWMARKQGASIAPLVSLAWGPNGSNPQSLQLELRPSVDPDNTDIPLQRNPIDHIGAPNGSDLKHMMGKLRHPGLLVTAHGTHGPHRTVRLQLSDTMLIWTRKTATPRHHHVPLSDIVSVDVGKCTAALCRNENANVPDNLCLSLLTRQGSLDLEAQNSHQRDVLVQCFESLISSHSLHSSLT